MSTSSTVQDILVYKGATVYCVEPDATVQEAAQLMNRHRIGALVVEEAGQIVGMFTERDVLRRVVVPRRDPARTLVREVMTQPVTCCRPDTPLGDARTVFKDRRIRHLPVVDEARRVLGLISIGDLNAHDAQTQEETIHYMRQYIYGRV